MKLPPAPPKIGDTLGGYTLQKRVGSGGNATVYEASSPDGKAVALKVLHPGQLSEEDLKRFEREYETLQMIDHPQIVRVFETGENDGHRWLAMEFIQGMDLETLAEQWRIEPPDDRWQQVDTIFRGLCHALHYLHEKGIVHRDLKPSNVLVDAEGQAKLMDFGVVKAPDVFSTALTVAGRLVGTVAFMSPEQITGETVGHQSDLYSLGAVLYVLLTCQRPIVADTIASYLARQLAQEPRRPALVEPQVPAKMDRICTRLLRKEPSQRYSSAEEVLAVLDSDDVVERPPLHGRDAALGRIRGALDALASGDSHVLGLVGHKGSGTSALVQEARSLAEERGIPLSMLDPQKGLAEAVSQRPDSGTWLLLADDLDRVPEWEVRELAVLFDAPEDAVGLLFSAHTKTGDLAIHNLGLRELLALPIARSELLPPLGRGDVIALLRDRGLSSTAAALLGRRLQEEIGGHPALLLEQVDALIIAGWIEETDSGKLKPTKMDRLKRDPLPLPEKVRTELEQSLAGLEPEERSQLMLLAVLGGQASEDLLARLAGLGVDRLTRLARTQLVQVREEGLHQVFQLANPRLRQVILEDLEPAERRSMHLEVAEMLSTGNPRRLGVMAEVVADHFLEARCPERAWPLLVQAAQRAARRRFYPQVLSLTRRALEATEAMETIPLDEETTDLSQRTLSLRGRALLATGRYREARAALEKALDLGLPTTSQYGRASQAALGTVLAEMGEAQAAADLLNPLVESIEPGDPIRFQALRSLGCAQRLLGELEEAQDTWELGCMTAREQGNSEQEGLFLLGLGQTLKAAGRLTESRQALQAAENRLRTNDTAELASCLIELGDLDLLDGSYRRALARAEDASAIAQQIDDLSRSALSLQLCARALAAVGMERDARRLLAEAEGLLRAREAECPMAIPAGIPPHDRVRSAIARSQTLQKQEGNSAALACLEDVLQDLPSEGCRGLELQLNTGLARLSENAKYRSRAQELARMVMETLPPELAAAFGAREEMAELLG